MTGDPPRNQRCDYCWKEEMESTKDRHWDGEQQRTEHHDRIQPARHKTTTEDRIKADHQDGAGGQVHPCCFHHQKTSRLIVCPVGMEHKCQFHLKDSTTFRYACLRRALFVLAR